VGIRLDGKEGAADERPQSGSDARSDHTEESLLGPSAAELVSLIGDGVISTSADGRIILFNNQRKSYLDIRTRKSSDVRWKCLCRLVSMRHIDTIS
jgi:hypothetical protein